MKKFLYIMLCLGAITFTSCDEEELSRPDSSLWEIAQTEQNEGAQLTVGTEMFDVKIGETKQYEITEGNGDYKLSVLDPDIAEVSLQDKTITVKGLKRGITEVVFSDKGLNYKSIKLNVYITDNLSVESQDGVKISLPLGNPKNQTINVIEGNQDYQAISSDKNIFTVTVSGDAITLTGVNAGEGSLTVKDSRGLSVVIPVVIEKIDSPYTDEELEAFKQLTDKGYYNDWIGFTLLTPKTDGNFIVDGVRWYVSNGNNYGISNDRYRWQVGTEGLNGSEGLILAFDSKDTDGHRTLGKKENMTLKYFKKDNAQGINVNISNVPLNYEVIKVDESLHLIWSVWSAQYEGTYYYGRFIMPDYAESSE